VAQGGRPQRHPLRPARDILDLLTADFPEAEPPVEPLGSRVRRIGVYLAGDPFVALATREGEQVLIEQGTYASALPLRRDHHTVDVQEALVARREPAEVDAVMVDVAPEGEREADDVAVIDCHPMGGGQRVEELQAFPREGGQNVDELLVQIEDRREVLVRRWKYLHKLKSQVQALTCAS